jgi:glyoxylase-like metal-dependent hydrolase (beta-lactamase superfamily II)
MDARMFTVGPVQENAYLIRRDGADAALLVDPGEEAPKLLGAIEALGVELKAILLTHCHFDHVGAVAPVAKATGAPVYCPQIEVPILQDIMAYVPWPGFGPFESWDPEHTVAGGETLQLAGFDVEVLFTPGHSPGHVTYAIADENALFSGDRIAGSGGDGSTTALFSGDVLFQSSIGRTDLPGGDHPTLLRSIGTLLDRFDDETVVHPGHMGLTPLGRERATNPFLTELAR